MLPTLPLFTLRTPPARPLELTGLGSNPSSSSYQLCGLGRSCPLFEPRFPHFKMGATLAPYFTGMLEVCGTLSMGPYLISCEGGYC